jgi:hypothetical protein
MSLTFALNLLLLKREYVTYLRTTVTNQNLIYEGIKSIFNSSNACYHSDQNFLSPSLSGNKIYRPVILPVVLNEYETWCCHMKGRTQTDGV